MPSSLAPLTHVDLADARGDLSVERAECPSCQKAFLGGAIKSGPVLFNDISFRYFVTRWLFCDHCDHIICWEQASDINGIHLGQILTRSPHIIRNRATIRRFLRAYPQMRGVLQS